MESTETQGTPAPNQVAPEAHVVAPPAPAEKDPAWLPDRLKRAEEQARLAVLADLGIDDPAKAKAFIKAGRDAEEQNKTLAEKLADHAAQLATAKSQAERYSGVIAAQANAQLAALTEEQRQAVAAIAGQDPAEQLRAIVALGPTWKVQLAPPVDPPSAPPASTSPPATAPPSVAAGSPPDHKAVHAQLQEKNPILAARYAQAHPAVFSE